MEAERFQYLTYLAATPERVWQALIAPEITAQYWQHENVSDWKPGSPWEHRRSGGQGVVDLVGKVVECVPPRRVRTRP
jgi:uncharacterized protein YndB with AHSA1/START domain